ncbi:MAG: hypothetical protein AB7K52_13845 [Phycisphaerales bacterium]
MPSSNVNDRSKVVGGQPGTGAPAAGTGAPGRSSPWPVVVAAVIVLATAIGLALVISRAAAKTHEYERASADDLIKSAVAMIRNGEASRLVELFHVERVEAKTVLRRVGELLGSMQSLGGAVADRFPDEVARLRDEAVKKAGETNAAGSIAAALQNRPSSAGARRRGPPSPQDQRTFEDFAKAVFADPFGWIDANADRLTTEYVSDDRAAVLFDGQPLPPVGLLLKEVEGRWYIDVPTNLPGASQFLPQTRHEYSILGSLIRVLDNVIKELADDVREGKIGRVEQLAEKAGEKAFGPAAMVFIVYGKEMDVRQRRERAMTDYRAAAEQWIAERTQLKSSLGPDWFTRLVEAMDQLAMEELDKLLRVDTGRSRRDPDRVTPVFKGMGVATFEQTLEEWLAGRGASVTLASATRDDVDAVIAAATGVAKPRGGK